jgi:hypothetical protein
MSRTRTRRRLVHHIRRVPDRVPGRGPGFCRAVRSGVLAALLFAFSATGQASEAEILARLNAEQRPHYEPYRAARTVFDRKSEHYWREVEAKRTERRRKRSAGEPFTRHDYVLDHPPRYDGPPLRPDIARIVADMKPPQTKPPLPRVGDFLRNAKEHYGFIPQTVKEREFKRRYAEEAVALGLTKDQVVRVYALETGGRGTHDMQAGIDPETKNGQPISSALGYAQLLHANSVSGLVTHGDRFVARLRTMATATGVEMKRARELEGKASVVRAMLGVARSVPNEWAEHVRLATTPKGLGIHALNLDADIGPWLQVVKLRGLKDEAERAGRRPLSGAEIELMNLAGPRTGLEMMELTGSGVPTANFFSRGGYARNPIVRDKTAGELLKAIEERMEVNVGKAGAVEFAQVFEDVLRRQRRTSRGTPVAGPNP